MYIKCQCEKCGGIFFVSCLGSLLRIEECPKDMCYGEDFKIIGLKNFTEGVEGEMFDPLFPGEGSFEEPLPTSLDFCGFSVSKEEFAI